MACENDENETVASQTSTVCPEHFSKYLHRTYIYKYYYAGFMNINLIT